MGPGGGAPRGEYMGPRGECIGPGEGVNGAQGRVHGTRRRSAWPGHAWGPGEEWSVFISSLEFF
jgi:hypothetical protein